MPSKPNPLRRLPRLVQYLIALTVVATVVVAAWLVGRDRPVPPWVTGVLAPLLGWLYLALLVVVIASRLRKACNARKKG